MIEIEERVGAHGELVMFLDDDDLLRVEYAPAAAAQLADPAADLADRDPALGRKGRRQGRRVERDRRRAGWR